MTALTERSEVQAAREHVSVIKSLLEGVTDVVGLSEVKYTATSELIKASRAVTTALGHNLDALDRALQLNEQEEERG